MGRTLFISAGEPSGDQHGARLINAIKRLDANAAFEGFGGPAMQRVGAKLIADMTQQAVMGFIEVLPKVAGFWRLAQQARKRFEQGGIEGVVLIDYPGFNWHIARYAKQSGIPVFYYCPPQLWAWAPWRIRKVRRYVDHVLTVLPFEHQWYQARQIAATFVGHPFFDAVAEQSLDQSMLDQAQVLKQQGERLIAILPGSRTKEIHANGPLLLEAARRIKAQHPTCRFWVAAYRETHAQWLRDKCQAMGLESHSIEWFVGKTSEIISSAECAMMVSGSVSLELMARELPAVVLYRVGRVTHAIASRLVHVPSFTLPNLIAEKIVYPEYLSVGDPEPAIQGLVHEVQRMLMDNFYRDSFRKELENLRSTIAIPGASRAAAEAVVDCLRAA